MIKALKPLLAGIVIIVRGGSAAPTNTAALVTYPVMCDTNGVVVAPAMITITNVTRMNVGVDGSALIMTDGSHSNVFRLYDEDLYLDLTASGCIFHVGGWGVSADHFSGDGAGLTGITKTLEMVLQDGNNANGANLINVGGVYDESLMLSIGPRDRQLADTNGAVVLDWSAGLVGNGYGLTNMTWAVPQTSTNDTPTEFIPRYVGDVLVIYASTNLTYRAYGLTTNDWSTP